MNERKIPWLLVIGGGVLVGLLLLACLIIIFPFTRPPISGSYRSNGEQIYFTATSQRGTPITSDLRMGMMGSGMWTCATCHGANGRGGTVRMMMRIFETPDIRYKTLTSPEEHAETEEHEPYTDEDIKRAITEGIEPDGKPLDWPMPRWSMSDEDLDDLLEFLKTLD
ncbi:MAG: cytochrome c [Anaerolineae bacterium]|jgi:cytochrome c553|nr:cytochrome c [Anaerolineae bacterium]MDH7473923.1 cytochrome c [Anaerolineae bacterium]